MLSVACGSSSSTPSAGPASSTPSSSAPAPAPSSPSSALCADAAALFASVDKLTHIKVAPGVRNEITANLTEVKANLTAFVAEAHGHWQAQTSALKSALTKLQTAVKNLGASPSASTVGGVLTAFSEVRTAAKNLRAAIGTRCPSTSPSPST